MNKRLRLLFLLIIFFLSLNTTFAQQIATDQPAIKSKPAAENKLDYNYASTYNIPIYLSITEKISTKDGLTEGQSVKFRVIKDAVYNEKTILKQDDIINGKIETIITSGMNGFPAEIIVDNFEIPDIKQSQLISTYTKKGQNRCLWVYPLKWSLTLIPFVGSLTNLIKGGHATIKTTDIITIYYYPQWP